jgi:hypothetical protein
MYPFADTCTLQRACRLRSVLQSAVLICKRKFCAAADRLVVPNRHPTAFCGWGAMERATGRPICNTALCDVS